MTTSHASTPISGESAKFSFLASHGLRSPLSSIRWACGRLRKISTGTLNEEQRELVDEIHANAKVLTTVLGSMQLLGRLEDRSYRLKEEELSLHDLLLSLTHGLEHPRDVEWSIRCSKDLKIRTDGPILESIIVNLLAVCTEGSRSPRRVSVSAKREGNDTRIAFSCVLRLPFLHGGAEAKDEVSRLVGGIPGLMLCLASAMAQSIHGTVELRETPAPAAPDGPGKCYDMTLTLREEV